MLQETNFDFSQLKFNFDLAKTNYQLDELQNRLLQFYLRADRRFRYAFNMNYTQPFLKYLKDKAVLKEPSHLAITGAVRGGKSYTAMTIALIHQAQYQRLFTSDYICANAFEFLDKLQKFPEDKLLNRMFLIDEQKQAVFGIGSMAKKVKLEDVQHIIAINNISTIMITPSGWANKEAHYGLRVFGRCFGTKTCRLMLYNLQERGKGGELPMGNIYLPIFTSFLPQPYAQQLEDDYLAKKRAWVKMEMRGEGDILETLKKKTAISFTKDYKYRELKRKQDRINYIKIKLGSEWTKGEIETIEGYTKLIIGGIISEESM